MTKDTHEMLARLERIGIEPNDALALRRIAMTLHRWNELECGDGNGCIERDETTGKPFWLYSGNYLEPKMRRHPIADREKGALKRLDAIMSRYPGLAAYVQTDPRGAALYVYRKADNRAQEFGIESCYSSIGVAVFK